MKSLIVFLLLPPMVLAQDLSRGKSITEIELARKKATLKFTTLVNGKGEQFTGFFYGNEGYFVTVHHSFRSSGFLLAKDGKLNITDSEGNEFEEGVINSCTNENNVDICVGKIKNHKPKYFLTYNGTQAFKGSEFNSFGICKEDFSSKKGKVVNVTDNYQGAYRGAWQDIYNKKTRLLELNIPACVGDSGGALFEPYTGNLMGMYSFELNNQYFAIDASEIDKYFKKSLNKIELTLTKEMFYSNKASTSIEEDPCKAKNLSAREKEFCSQ